MQIKRDNARQAKPCQAFIIKNAKTKGQKNLNKIQAGAERLVGVARVWGGRQKSNNKSRQQ